MPVSNRIKNTLASYLLSRELRYQQRFPAAVSLDTASLIGIVYDSTNEKVYELIRKTVKDLRSQHKDVLAIGYYDKKVLPPLRFSKLGMDFFTRKNLNWQLRPMHAVAENFISIPFDILIVLHSDYCLPVRYIAAHSRARFKIGKFDPSHAAICDMMIDAGNSANTHRLLEQILKYLTMIKNDYQKT